MSYRRRYIIELSVPDRDVEDRLFEALLAVADLVDPGQVDISVGPVDYLDPPPYIADICPRCEEALREAHQ